MMMEQGRNMLLINQL